MSKLSHVAEFEMLAGAVLSKNFYCGILFGNVTVVDAPQITFV